MENAMHGASMLHILEVAYVCTAPHGSHPFRISHFPVSGASLPSLIADSLCDQACIKFERLDVQASAGQVSG